MTPGAGLVLLGKSQGCWEARLNWVGSYRFGGARHHASGWRGRAGGWVLLASAGLVLVAGCQQSIEQGLQSEDPVQRIEACIKAARCGDARVVPLLIERLEDSSADVRFYAIRAIEAITGDSHGYRFYAPPAERRAVVERLRRKWLKRVPPTGGGR